MNPMVHVGDRELDQLMNANALCSKQRLAYAMVRIEQRQWKEFAHWKIYRNLLCIRHRICSSRHVPNSTPVDLLLH